MIIDIVVVVVLLISAFIAFLRGLIREVLTIAGVAGGLAAAFFGGPYLTPLMNNWLGVKDGETPEKLFDILPYDMVAVALSYGLIFIIVVVVLSIASHYLAESVKKAGLGAVDRSLGFLFGLARGILLLGLLYMPVHLFVEEDTKKEYLEGSRTSVYLESTSEALAGFIPEGAAQDMKEDIDKISENASKEGSPFKEIDLLKEHRQRESEGEGSGTETGGGYDADFREKMDALFEDKNQSGDQ